MTESPDSPERTAAKIAVARASGGAENHTLNYSDNITDQGALNHLGIEVETTAAVLAAKERLQKAGLATQDEMNVDCCFALQDKVWIADPDGNRWEVFTVGGTQPGLKVSPVELETSQRPICCSPIIS